MKTAISIPDDLFKAADRVARRLGISRSELYQRAVAKYLASLRDAAVTAELDDLYARIESPELDPILGALQKASLVRDDW